MPKLWAFMSLTLFTITAWAGGSGEVTTPSQEPLLVIQDAYNRVHEFHQYPERLVSVAPNLTEIIYALEGEDLLVGRSDYCDYPQEVGGLPSVGALKEPNIEKIISLNPDLVLASSHFPQSASEALEALDIPIAILQQEESLEGVYKVLGQMGQILNKQVQAQTLITEMKEKISQVQKRVKGAPPKGVYYVISYGQYGDFTAGGDTFIGNLITLAGGENIAQDVSGWGYSLEKIIQENPEIIICSQYWNTKEGLETSEGYKDLPAIAQGRLYEIDNNLLDRHGPRLAQGLEALARIIHPELF